MNQHNQSQIDQRKRRTVEISNLFRNGLTQDEIATKLGVSRQRISQLLLLEGVSKRNGGRLIVAERKKLALRAKLEATYFRVHGMERAEYKSIGRGAKLAFKEQRINARNRGIEWRFLFSEWWHIWKTSGKWTERGRKRGRYVMARFGDTGPYAVGNVQIVTCSENVKEARDRERKRRKKATA